MRGNLKDSPQIKKNTAKFSLVAIYWIFYTDIRQSVSHWERASWDVRASTNHLHSNSIHILSFSINNGFHVNIQNSAHKATLFFLAQISWQIIISWRKCEQSRIYQCNEIVKLWSQPGFRLLVSNSSRAGEIEGVSIEAGVSGKGFLPPRNGKGN